MVNWASLESVSVKFLLYGAWGSQKPKKRFSATWAEALGNRAS
jgi:hypothetical protein